MGMERVDKGDEYTCNLCGETYTATIDADEADQEYEEYFGEPQDDDAVICDDCWKKMHPDDHPDLLSKANLINKELRDYAQGEQDVDKYKEMLNRKKPS